MGGLEEEKREKGEQFDRSPSDFYQGLKHTAAFEPPDRKYFHTHGMSNTQNTTFYVFKSCLQEQDDLEYPCFLQSSPESFPGVMYDLIATDRVMDRLFWLPFGSVKAPISKPDIGNEISRLTSVW